MTNFEDYLKERGQLINDYLVELTKGSLFKDKLGEAMKYSLLAGGKRLRPILVLAAYETCGGKDLPSMLPVAAALECIHTSSLIHDDLPAMDNDDYRRGKLTNHKVYGDAMAILAGDGLLIMAFELLTRDDLNPALAPAIRVRLVEELARATGSEGMVGGQSTDILSEGKKISLDELRSIHSRKTGALIRASVRMGAIGAEIGEDQLEALTQFSDSAGLAFQIADDILNVTSTREELGKGVGTDVVQEKATYPQLVGLDEAKKLAEDEVETAINILNKIPGNTETLKSLVKYIVERKK
ncbi:MAG: farnesyl diphosphate synthase [Candidatus Komeilibacteria bacterium]